MRECCCGEWSKYISVAHKSGVVFKSACDEFGEAVSRSELVDLAWSVDCRPRIVCMPWRV